MEGVKLMLHIYTILAAVFSVQGCTWCLSKSSLFSGRKPLPIEDLISQFGYPVESHVIQTEDGYQLTYHRIPRGKDPGATSGKPVLVQHGILGSSPSWVLSEDSLAFVLADAGFDVWLANSRGNTYSRKHIKYDPDVDKKKFWDFSWHEIGHYDIPASIDYILLQTGQEKLLFVGHSMGSTAYFVMGATRPEYMEKIQTAVIMAPIVYPWHVRGHLYKFLYTITETLSLVVKATGTYEVLPLSNSAVWLDLHICSKRQLEVICKDLLEGVGLYQSGIKRIDLSRVLEYNPAGASYKQLHHYKQISKQGTAFQQFDYGLFGNLKKYRSRHPPVYDLNKATAPMYIYYAVNDWKAVPEDVFHLCKELPNVIKVTKIEDDKFNHLDFMWALSAKQLIYDDIVSTLHEVPQTT